MHRHFGNPESRILDLLHHLQADDAAALLEAHAVENRPPQEAEVAIDVAYVQSEQRFHRMVIDTADDDPVHRVVIGRIYHHTVKTLFGLRVRDVDCDFRLMRRSIFERVELEKSSGVICLEMMKKIQDAGFRIAEVPVHHYHRAYGRSQFFNFRRLFKTGVDVINLWVELVIRGEHRHRTRASAAAAHAGVSPPGDHV